ncbi:hypothetical protein [Nocardia transvalensis]|nr:hypothetical protein [Nocardia transvalensis]MBF6327975.1 hypothetical protein [Nocardia transvalensis]
MSTIQLARRATGQLRTSASGILSAAEPHGALPWGRDERLAGQEVR